MRICIATGTRADWGLLKPLADALKSRGVEVLVVATHQHLIPEMGNTVDELIADGYPPIARIPAQGIPAEIMAAAAVGFANLLPRLNPDMLIILGDRCEMLGVASAALLCGTPITHIAGGTISEGAFDDSVRHAITKMASLHFPETEHCAARIRQMGEDPKRIFPAGALGVYNALNISLMSREELSESLDNFNLDAPFLVVTLHAATLEPLPPLAIQENMLSSLEKLLPSTRLIITYPNCDADPTPLINSLKRFEALHPQSVKLIPSLGRRRYLSAVALSAGVVGNSSSALVEVPSLGVPSLNIGIRQKGRECGLSVIHCGISEEEISSGLTKLLSPDMSTLAAKKENPYFHPHTPTLMAEIIISSSIPPFPSKSFHPLKKPQP